MEKRIKMYNPKTGKSKNGFIGFSWPILFLAWIPMFARGDIRSGLELIAVQLGCLYIQSCGFQSFYLIFIVIQVMVSISYNIYYTKGLIRKGFLFNDTDVLNGIGAKTVGISVKNCVFYQNGTSNLDDNSDDIDGRQCSDMNKLEDENVDKMKKYSTRNLDDNSDDIGSRHCSDINNFEDENVDKPISSLAVRKISKLSSSEIQKYGAIFFLTISAVLGYVEYSYTDTIFYVVEIEKKLSLEPTLITTLFSFIYIMTMTIRVKSEIIFCKENRTVGYYISEWILLVLSVLVTAMFFSIFTNSCESDVLSFADIHGITGKHLLLAAVMFSFVGARSLAGFIWIAVIFVGISNAIDADKAMGIFGVIFAICSILGLSLQFIRLYADQFGAMIKSDFMGARTIISGDVAEAKNVAGAIAKQAVNIGMTYVNPEIAIAHNAIGCKQRKKNSPEEKVVDLSDYKNRNNRKRLIHKRK
ncbi:hypothetical protein [Desulfovibrio sp.]|uniref:hypothetical protein n=1 Tax=Desulfovibrio sp. TaxID=885 RepID=UPI0030789979